MDFWLIRGVTVMAVVAAVALYDLAMMLTARWERTITWVSNGDERVYVLLSVLLLIAWLHLTYERVANGR